MIKTTWLDVSIPFVGEAETFRVAPSSMAVLFKRATIDRNALTVRVVENDAADKEVPDFKNMVEGNLQILRNEYQQHKPQLEQAIQQAAAQRKAQVDAEDARDQTRSFRVKN